MVDNFDRARKSIKPEGAEVRTNYTYIYVYMYIYVYIDI